MSDNAVQLFLAGLNDLQQKVAPGSPPVAGELPEFDDPDLQARATAFREDLVAVLSDPKLAETWSPESLSAEEVFACYAYLAEAYLRGSDDERRPFLRRMIQTVRDLSEEPGYIQLAMPVIADAPVDRWLILAHGGIVTGAAKEAKERSWPASKEVVMEAAHRLTRPDTEPGANFHVKFLKDMGLVKVTKKPKLVRDMTGTAADLWQFVSLTDEGVRFLWMLGFG